MEVSLSEEAFVADENSAVVQFLADIAEMALVADLTVGKLYWTPIDDTQDANWGGITNTQTANWQNINDTQTTNWQNIGNAQTPSWAAVDDTQNPAWTPISTN
jgi:hypothetical protein